MVSWATTICGWVKDIRKVTGGLVALAVLTGLFCMCAVWYGSHQPSVATDHWRCGKYD